MAGRYSKEYRPSEFVKLPFEEVAKVMAMKEQQYQQGYLQPAAYQQEMGKVEVRTPDIEYHQQLIKQATDKARQLAEETYGGDYGAAASDITRTLANEASNPFYSWTKSKMDEYKKAKAIDMELTAKGQKLGFNTDLLNKSYFDKENNKYNTELGFDVEQKLDWDKKMDEIATGFARQVRGGNEQSFADAMKGKMQSANGRTWYDQKDVNYSGTALADEKHGKEKAYDTFKTTADYVQMKRTLTDKNYAGSNALSESDAENYIKKIFNGVMESKLRLDYDISSKPISEGIQKGYNADGTKIKTPEMVFPETSNTNYIYEDNLFKGKFDNFKKNVFGELLPNKSLKQRNEELEQVKTNIHKIKSTDDPNITASLVRRKVQLENAIKSETEKYNKTPISSLSKGDKLKIINDPSFKGMRGLVSSLIDSGLTFGEFESKIQNAATSIRNNATTLPKQFKMSLNSPQEFDSVYKNISNSQKETFKASDLGGGDRYTKDEVMGILSSDPKATSEIRGDGSIIVHAVVKDGKKYKSKDIVIPSSSFSNEKRQNLVAIWTVLDTYNQFGSEQLLGNVKGDNNQISTIPFEENGQLYYPAVSPLDRTVKLLIKTKDGYVNSGETRDLSEVISAYHAGFIGTTTQYNNTTNIAQ